MASVFIFVVIEILSAELWDGHRRVQRDCVRVLADDAFPINDIDEIAWVNGGQSEFITLWDAA